MTKVFKAAIGLKQQTKKAIVGTMPAYCTVSSVNDRMVEVTMDGDGEPSGWYPSVTRSNYTGLRGLLVPVQGGSAYFQPMGSSYPIGSHDYALDGIAVGAVATALGTRHISIGSGAQAMAGPDNISIGTGAYTWGTNTTAIGKGASAEVGGTTAIGAESSATSWFGTAVGSGAKSNAYGFAGGRLADSGTEGVAIGVNAKSGVAGITIGRNSQSGAGIAIGNTAVSAGLDIVIGSGASTTLGSNWGKIAIGNNATNNFERGFALGRNATTTKNDQGILAVNELWLVNSLGTAGSVISLLRTDGTRVYLRVNNSNVLTVGTS